MVQCAPIERGYPQDLKKPEKMARGESNIRQEVYGSLTATAWKDKKEVNMLSTLSDLADIREFNCRAGQESIRGSQPASVAVYIKYVNGVDRHDQMRMQYPVRRFLKNTGNIFFIHCNCVIVNFYIVYKEVTRRQHKQKVYTQLNFRIELASALVGGFTKRKRKAQPSYMGPVTDLNMPAHTIEHMSTKTKKCR